MVSASLEGMAAVLYVLYLNVTLASQPCSIIGRSRNQARPFSHVESRRLKFSGKSKSQTSEGGAFETYRICSARI